MSNFGTTQLDSLELHEQDYMTPHEIISSRVVISKLFLVVVSLITFIYFTWWLDFSNAGNIVLYLLLVLGEAYHVFQAIGYIYTIWDERKIISPELVDYPDVDIFITVAGEPVSIVRRTVEAALDIDYPNFKVYILNDGYVVNSENWSDIADLAKEYEIEVITRRTPGGAKAGNVNNALDLTSAPFFALFDADHVPHKDYLKKTMGFFRDPKIALVQTPQYYENRDDSFLTTAAWEQQELFFGPICRGKNRMNATFWCGTNAALRREALLQVGGVPTDNIAEDFLASMFIHERGWKTIYLPEILAQGLSPHDLQSYVKQQFRWARGSLEVIFKYNPLFRKGLTWQQKFQYLYSSGYYLNGLVVAIDALIPVIVLITGIRPVNESSTDFIVYFFPFMFATIYILMTSTQHTVTFRALQLSISSFYVFIRATWSTITGKKAKFEITPKEAQSGNYLKLAAPHLGYVGISLVAILVGVLREGLVPSVMTNISWIIFNTIFFSAFIRCAYPWKESYLYTMSYIKNVVVSAIVSKAKIPFIYQENLAYVPEEINVDSVEVEKNGKLE